jgi:hypothetical protein
MSASDARTSWCVVRMAVRVASTNSHISRPHSRARLRSSCCSVWSCSPAAAAAAAAAARGERGREIGCESVTAIYEREIEREREREREREGEMSTDTHHRRPPLCRRPSRARAPVLRCRPSRRPAAMAEREGEYVVSDKKSPRLPFFPLPQT